MARPVRLAFLGGLGRIGRNCATLEVDGRLLIVDCGQMFPDDTEPGIDVILPDFTYLREQAGRIDGCLLTHAHEDHIGALPYLLRDLSFPIYGSPFTLGLVRHKLDEAGVLNRAELIPIGDHQRRRIGTFDCEFLPVTHSTPSSLLTVFRTPQGVIVHSGDFKIDPLPIDGRITDVDRVAAIAKEEGVRLLLADSTNADSPGSTKSETHIGDVLRGVFQANRGRRVIVASFASHVHRLQQVADIAVEEGRKIAILGTSMVRNTKLARDIGLMHIPSTSIIPPDELGDLDPARVCVICTGSQGESRAVLWQLVTGENRYMSISKDDTVVLSAHPIPGNETSVARLRNRLTLLGARVVHDGILEVHTSGHAKQDELATLMRAANPEWFVPIHGEVAHLAAHAELARQVLPIAEDHVVVCAEGDTLVLSDSGMAMGPEIPARRVYVHGTVDGVDEAVLKDRKTLGDDGFVAISVDVQLGDRLRINEPRVISRGWAADHDRTMLHEAVADAVRRALRDLLNDPPDEGTTREQVERAVRRAAGATVNERSRRRPMIVPVVTYH